MQKLSILETNTKDALVFYLTPVLIVSLLLLFPNIWEHPLILFIVFLFVDMGHAYATFFRTYFRKNEIVKMHYWYLPIMVFLLIFAWAYLGIPFLWSFLLYFTFFHHIKQYYGISAWYAKKQQFNFNTEKKHLYLLTIIPFIIFHFRNIKHTALYQENELFLFGEMEFSPILIGLFLVYLCVQITRWILNKEIKKMLLLSLIYPSLIHSFCFLYFDESFKAFIPLLVMHGISYMSLVAFSMKKINHYSYFKASLIIILFVLLLVFLENTLLDSYDVFLEPQFLKGNLLISSLASLAVLPNLLHYIFDSFIWKKQNEDFQKIMKD